MSSWYFVPPSTVIQRAAALAGVAAPTVDARVGLWHPFAVAGSVEWDRNDPARPARIRLRWGWMVSQRDKEFTLLHELAHVSAGTTRHGRLFRRVLARLVAGWFGVAVPSALVRGAGRGQDAYAFDRAVSRLLAGGEA